MRKYNAFFITLFLLAFAFGNSFAQQDSSDNHQLLKKVLKKKFIENLGLDKESADKFFRLYNESRKNINELTKKQKEILEYINENYEDQSISLKIDEMIENESKIFELRKNFINSLKEFLTPQQIAKSIVMQQKMRKMLSGKTKE